MAEPLSAGITRDRAFELLNEHNKDPFHITHGETVEGTMRYFAREFDPENEEFWGIVGLLHDLDWEEHEDDPMNTPSMRPRSLKARALSRSHSRHSDAHVGLQHLAAQARAADGKDPVCLRRAHRLDRCCRHHASE